MRASTGSGRTRRGIAIIGLGVVALYGSLLIPEPAPPPPEPASERPFQWNEDERWLALEQRFRDQQRGDGGWGQRPVVERKVHETCSYLDEKSVIPCPIDSCDACFCYTLRHSLALVAGYDIRTVRQLLGHRDLQTTMIYTKAFVRTITPSRNHSGRA